MNEEIGIEVGAIPFLGIFVSHFRYCVFAVGDSPCPRAMEELRDLGKVVFAKIVTETPCIGGLSYLYSKRGPLSSLWLQEKHPPDVAKMECFPEESFKL